MAKETEKEWLEEGNPGVCLGCGVGGFLKREGERFPKGTNSQ